MIVNMCLNFFYQLSTILDSHLPSAFYKQGHWSLNRGKNNRSCPHQDSQKVAMAA